MAQILHKEDIKQLYNHNKHSYFIVLQNKKYDRSCKTFTQKYFADSLPLKEGGGLHGSTKL